MTNDSGGAFEHAHHRPNGPGATKILFERCQIWFAVEKQS